MGLRLFGGLIAILLAAYAVYRLRRRRLSRGELLILVVTIAGLAVAALIPRIFDPVLSELGLPPGDQRRLIGLLVFSNLFTIGLVLRAFVRIEQVRSEVGDHVDYIALRRFTSEYDLPQRDSCVVVIPAFNEAQSLPAVLGRLPSQVLGLTVCPIVVADGCTDQTEEVACNHGAMVIRRELRRGQGAAVRLGYLAALQGQARVVVTMDADGQHDPAEMERLVSPLLEDRADMVQGSRILGDGEVDSRARSAGVTFYARVLSGVGRSKITDPSNGYRAVTPHALRKLDLRQDQFFVSELMIDAMHAGLRVVEVPITVSKRIAGASRKGTNTRYALGFSRTLLGTWLRQSPGGHRHQLPRWLSKMGPHHDDA